VLETSVEEWDECFRLNVTGAWFSIMTCLDLLAAGNKESPYGKQGIKSQVLITSSIAAFNRGAGSSFAYVSAISYSLNYLHLGVQKSD
jgi:NAD(P)-dependent dehydrogenase (short-subunit alcohol dehydrogenase family)